MLSLRYFITNAKAKEAVFELSSWVALQFNQYFASDVSLEALDLLKKLIEFNPKDRLTAVEALDHPFLMYYSGKVNEPIAETVFDNSFEFDVNGESNMAEEAVRRYMFDEVMLY